MRKWKVNSYVLSVCVLISEYVRQQQDIQPSGEDSVASIVDGLAPPAPSCISKSSLNALARFLTVEIQHPMGQKSTQDKSLTSLKSLLKRLELAIDSQEHFKQLSYQLVSILTKMGSPDAVWNAVEQISECVAPLKRQEEAEEEAESASSSLVRTSLFGVFVRSFLLAVNRLLFDGLSRLFDDVTQYIEQFQEDMEQEKESSFELLSSPQGSALVSQNLWEKSKQPEENLQLSPIHSGSSTPLKSEIPATYLSTPDPSRSVPEASNQTDQQVKTVREINDPAVWSNDQLNYVLSDMIREMEGGRRTHQDESQREELTESQSPREQLRKIRQKMDETNPNVLFAKYLSYLNDRDYQGALDSLHQYHDVLSPRQEPLLGSDGNASGSAGSPAGGAGLHFRGSGIQYAALNLAGLQILFDHYSASQESIQEAIRVAQHHGDHICVAFALAWLIHINQKLGTSKDAVLQLVTSCLNRAEELRLPSLKVLATLTEVESELTRGTITRPESTAVSGPQFLPHVFAAHVPAPRPLHLWSRLHETTQSIGLISTPVSGLSGNGTRAMNPLQAQMTAGTDSPERSGGTGMEWIKSAEAILDTVWKLSGKVTISAAIGWSLFGQRSLEQVFSRMHLVCYEDTASYLDIVLMVSQMAMSNLAQVKTGEIVYVNALRFLVDTIDSKATHRHLVNEAPYQRTLNRLFFLWALKRGEFARAEVHLQNILALSPEENDFPAYLEALKLQASFLAAQGDHTQSLAILEKLNITCSELGFTYLHAQVLILISRTRFQAAAPHAPFASLNVLLKSVDICKSHHYDLLLAEAHVVIAEIYIAMGKLQDAHALIDDQMPLVMEHGSINLRGECLLVLAKTMIASIKRSKTGAREPSRVATKAFEMLSASEKMFSAVENLGRLKETSYLQSLIYNHVALQADRCGGDSASFYTSREAAAKAFLERSAQLKRAPFLTVEPFFDLESAESIRRVLTHRSNEH